MLTSLPLLRNYTGEPFTQEEMEEMLSAALDPEKNIIAYKDFVTMMVIDDAHWPSADNCVWLESRSIPGLDLLPDQIGWKHKTL